MFGIPDCVNMGKVFQEAGYLTHHIEIPHSAVGHELHHLAEVHIAERHVHIHIVHHVGERI